MTTADLLRMKEKVESARDNKSRAEGTKAELLRRLKDEHRCRTIAEAKKKIEQLTKSRDASREKLNEGIEALKGILLE